MVLYSRPRTKTTSTEDWRDHFGTDQYRNSPNSRLPARQIKQEYRRAPAGPDSPPLTLDGRALHFCLSFSFQLFFFLPFLPYASVVFVPIVVFSLFSFSSVFRLFSFFLLFVLPGCWRLRQRLDSTRDARSPSRPPVHSLIPSVLSTVSAFVSQGHLTCPVHSLRRVDGTARAVLNEPPLASSTPPSLKDRYYSAFPSIS